MNSLLESLKGIKFEKTQLIFKAGESIKGSLLLQCGPGVRNGCKFSGLKLILTRNVMQTVHFSWLKINSRQIKRIRPTQAATPPCIFSFNVTNTPIILEPDTLLELPFELDLHPSLYSTFVGKNAYVAYGLKISGTAVKKFGNSDLTMELEELRLMKDVVILGNVGQPERRLGPDEGRNLNKSVLYKSKSNEEVKLRVKVDKLCFRPGEKLEFFVEVINGLKTPLSVVKASLQQNVKYNVFWIPEEAKIVAHKEGVSVPPGPGRRVTWNGSLNVPYTVPTGLGGEKCPFIDVQYVLAVTLVRYVNLRVYFPIHIATAAVEGEGDAASMDNLDAVSLAYGLEMSRDFTASQYSLDLDSMSLSSASCCWAPVQDAQRGGGGTGRSGDGAGPSNPRRRGSNASSAPPPYLSEWDLNGANTPPPKYDDVVDSIQ